MTKTTHAPDVGGFACPGFIDVVQRHHPLGEWRGIEDGDTFLPTVLDGDVLTFAGHEDLIDYRTPVGPKAVDILADILRSESTASLRVDSLPAEAAEMVTLAARSAGRVPVVRDHETTARLDVSGGFDAYLADLSKKERHELRRKRRRYEEELGPAELVRESGSGDLVEEFIRLHRAAEGDKGEFMTKSMAQYFRDVLVLPGWHVDGLVEQHGRITAAAFSYQDDRGYYLYNSGYDPELRHLSPGIVLLGALIERIAESERTIFDFLKGDEAYKYRLGASARQLYVVTA